MIEMCIRDRPYDYLLRDDPVAMAECTLLVQEYLDIDLIIANLDIYNFEAEAMGAELKFYPDHCSDIVRSNYLKMCIRDRYKESVKMINKVSRAQVRQKKHRRMRNHIAGTAARPRLAVFRSNSHMYAQIIDDTVGHTLVSASTLQKDVKAELEKTNDVKAAAYLGTVIGKKAVEAGIKEVVFDRGGFIYQGKIQALADAAREAGLEF